MKTNKNKIWKTGVIAGMLTAHTRSHLPQTMEKFPPAVCTTCWTKTAIRYIGLVRPMVKQ